MSPTDAAPADRSDSLGAAVLGVDVGGTTVKARLFASDQSVLGEWRVATPRNDTSALATIAAIRGVLAEADAVTPVQAVGLAIPGVVDDSAGVSVNSVNLGWSGLPVRDLLGAATGLPVGFGQDVRVGAVAESSTGAARDVEDMAFVPVGTGLASAFVTGGVPLVSGGWAGEIGQVVIRHGAHRGRRVEEVASAGGLARRLGAGNAREVADRVRAQDPAALAAWTETVEVLADTLSWIAAVAAPEMIVVGGGLAESGDLLFAPLQHALDERLAFSRRPVLARALHGDAAAIVGAGLLARKALAES
ncbi:sugar kinase [Frondihabitans sucicola]|uniref:Sugar kinase n=1 Tax=Frondihabitans sucicola TaxID=1268041 RepID=A0ABN6Y1A7_9MICO|nr:ROK family protein [Frondihabitans sucicola]BDZ49788.1 sugar kinase [Frondihabitans sucicola]